MWTRFTWRRSIMWSRCSTRPTTCTVTTCARSVTSPQHCATVFHSILTSVSKNPKLFPPYLYSRIWVLLLRIWPRSDLRASNIWGSSLVLLYKKVMSTGWNSNFNVFRYRYRTILKAAIMKVMDSGPQCYGSGPIGFGNNKCGQIGIQLFDVELC